MVSPITLGTPFALGRNELEISVFYKENKTKKATEKKTQISEISYEHEQISDASTLYIAVLTRSAYAK